MAWVREAFKFLPWKYFPVFWCLPVWPGMGFLALLPIPEGFWFAYWIVSISFAFPVIFVWGVCFSIFRKDWWMLGVYLVVAGGPIVFYLLAVNDVFGL